jgi:hypothetical protein
MVFTDVAFNINCFYFWRFLLTQILFIFLVTLRVNLELIAEDKFRHVIQIRKKLCSDEILIANDWKIPTDASCTEYW